MLVEQLIGDQTKCILVDGNDVDLWVLQSITRDNTTDAACKSVRYTCFRYLESSLPNLQESVPHKVRSICRPEWRGDAPVDSDVDLKSMISDGDVTSRQ